MDGGTQVPGASHSPSYQGAVTKSLWRYARNVESGRASVWGVHWQPSEKTWKDDSSGLSDHRNPDVQQDKAAADSYGVARGPIL
jgi:hypothetical protein